MELSHAGPRTQANPRPPGKPDALPGVGCSDFVRTGLIHNSGSLRTRLLWQLNESGRLPEISATLLAVQTRETLDLALRNLLTADNLLDGPAWSRWACLLREIIHSDDSKDLVLLSHGV